MTGRLRRRVVAEARAAAVGARNARFAASMRTDPGGPVVILSPHLDDSVLDCWSVLTRPGRVEVLNVFAGLPESGPAGPWERLVGADDPRELMAERIAEDRQALALAGRAPVGLSFREASHRPPGAQPTWAQLDRALRSASPAVSHVFAPAVLGTVHDDHLLVRSFALALARAGVPVTLYADLPYAVVYGWPSWVTGDEGDPRLDVDAYWDATRHRARAPAGRENARVVRLDDDAAALKLRALRTYRTQFAMLDRGDLGLISDPRVHRFEVFWPVRA